MSTPPPQSFASRKLKIRLVLLLIFVGFALLFSWLVLAESSPLNDYFDQYSGLREAWQSTLIIPYILSAVITGNPHSPSTILLVSFTLIQWCLIGWLLSIPLSKLWLSRQNR